MNLAYDQIVGADDQTRAGLFGTTAQRIGTTPQNVEKDFWVCWTLDALFNGRPDPTPRLLFKGGTSLSKGFGLISRFSEDIDVTVFRDDLGEQASAEELQRMSATARKRALDAIAEACAAYVQGHLRDALSASAAEACARSGLAPDRLVVRPADDDPQSLKLWYPPATPTDGYVEQAVKIELGAKSALDPHEARTLQPYLAEDVPQLALDVANVVTVDPLRTFWDKVVILHGLRSWYVAKGALRGEGQRVSRHYYDLHRLLASDVGPRALGAPDLGADCVAHARLFFNRPPFDLATACPPTFALTPVEGMTEALRRDYSAMRGMIFGSAPEFAAILDSVGELEHRINALGGWRGGEQDAGL